MGSLQFNLPGVCSPALISKPCHPQQPRRALTTLSLSRWRTRSIEVGTAAPTAAAETAAPRTEPEATTAPDLEAEPPSVDFAFVSSRLLPDGTPDIQIRSACGGQKLRNIMLDSHIDLYGPYARPLLNCGGAGTCRTCIVEVIEGKELLSPRTDKEKEAFKRKPKTWRLACQTMVGEQESRGQVVIQQLPEWKAHEWDI